ncbi:hypothetical protein SAMN05445756_0326 [Kytococcus aerolatus]|uniref:SAV-6107-like HEPN domain-containing protein n=1 Tax=Kytococcus aerolatus TaxID=592308 RepID=A0A212T4B6_9MICO|nr:SAV_6107 family HEPN domain-containing protein [Kytococcus aerolatus]SNC60671.1 hypothetical protein SAMN05445756_0326 [Kytococcus aerolatus]
MTTMTMQGAIPGGCAGTVLSLVERARESLAEACATPEPELRYEAAHLGALRAAAAVVAARSVPGERGRPRSVWELLVGVAPELQEWAVFFADSARRRSALAGGQRCSQREADDLVRQVEEFEATVRRVVGLPVLPPATAMLVGAGVVGGRG